jgi:AraC-like DNA-binding protein
MFSGPLDLPRQKLFEGWLIQQIADVDEAASLLSTSAVPYRCEMRRRDPAFSTHISRVQGPRTQLSRVRTTGAMTVHAQLPSDSYAMIFAVSGEVEHRVEGAVVSVRPGCGFLQSPTQRVKVQTPEHFEVLFLKLQREHLVQELENMLLRKIQAPLVFSSSCDMRDSAGQSFRRLVAHLCVRLGQTDLDREPKVKQSGLTLRTLEDGLITLLLDSQRHNYTRLLARNPEAGPWQVRAAEEFMSANAHLTLSLGDICLAAGVGSRTLQHSFQRRRGCSPMQFLRRLRLDGVYADLSRPDETATVTEIASRWNFLHFGRFAGEYSSRFGEKPSETAHRCRKA